MLNLEHHRSAERTNAGFCGVFDVTVHFCIIIQPCSKYLNAVCTVTIRPFVYIALEPLPYPVFWLIIKQVVMGEDAWVYGLYH